MTFSAQTPPSSSSPPASYLNRCGACRWWSRQTAAVGLCKTFDLQMRADAVGCPSWRRRSEHDRKCGDCAGWDGGSDDLGPCLFLRKQTRRGAVGCGAFVLDPFPARQGRPLSHVLVSGSFGDQVLDAVADAMRRLAAKEE